MINLNIPIFIKGASILDSLFTRVFIPSRGLLGSTTPDLCAIWYKLKYHYCRKHASFKWVNLAHLSRILHNVVYPARRTISFSSHSRPAFHMYSVYSLFLFQSLLIILLFLFHLTFINEYFSILFKLYYFWYVIIHNIDMLVDFIVCGKATVHLILFRSVIQTWILIFSLAPMAMLHIHTLNL